MVVLVLPKLILQTCMHSHPAGIDVRFLVGPFVYFHSSCVRTVKAFAKLCGCAGSPLSLRWLPVISTIISWAGSYTITLSYEPHSNIHILSLLLSFLDTVWTSRHTWHKQLLNNTLIKLTTSITDICTVVPRYNDHLYNGIIFTTETLTSDGISLGTDLFLSKFTTL